MKVGFRADNDLDRDIVRGLLRLEPNIDFEAEPLNGLDDQTVLLIASREDRILVTHDISTIPPLFFRLREEHRLPGVILTPQIYPIGKAVEQLHLIWVLTETTEWRNRICFLPTLADFIP
jgi:hypothetical protein